MDTFTIIAIVVSLLTALICGGGGFLFFLFLIVGIILLRRRGKKVTVKAAVSAGAESVSQVFMKTEKGLQAVDEDDD